MKPLYIFANKLPALKKIILIGLLLVLAYSQVGYYFVMQASQQNIKEEMKEKIRRSLKTEDLQTISFTDNQNKIFWEEDEQKEFSFNGQMYDVVSRTIINGKEILYCINDKKEQQLIDKYNSITKNNSAAGKKIKEINSIILFTETDKQINCLHQHEIENQFQYFTSSLYSVWQKNTSPPPKV